MSGRGGAYSEMCWHKQDGGSVLGMGSIQQAGDGGGTKSRTGLPTGLKEKEVNGPWARSRRSLAGLKTSSGLKEDLKRLKNEAHTTTYGAASLGGEYGPVLYGL